MVAALLDAASMREIMASQRTAFVKFDFGPKCKDCIELNPVWHALARETPGTLWRVDCLDSPDVCKERMVSAAVDDLEAAEPVFKSFNGTRWRRLARKATPQTLKEYVKAKGSAARVFNPGRRGGDSAWDAPPERPQQQPQANYDVGSGGARGARTEEEMQARRERARRERAETLERNKLWWASARTELLSYGIVLLLAAGVVVVVVLLVLLWPFLSTVAPKLTQSVSGVLARAAASVASLARAPGRLWSERRRASEAKLAEARAAKVASQLIAEEQVRAPASPPVGDLPQPRPRFPPARRAPAPAPTAPAPAPAVEAAAAEAAQAGGRQRRHAARGPPTAGVVGRAAGGGAARRRTRPQLAARRRRRADADAAGRGAQAEEEKGEGEQRDERRRHHAGRRRRCRRR